MSLGNTSELSGNRLFCVSSDTFTHRTWLCWSSIMNKRSVQSWKGKNFVQITLSTYQCYSQAENSKSMPERVAKTPAVPSYPRSAPAPISTTSCTEVCGLENTNVHVSWIWAAKENVPSLEAERQDLVPDSVHHRRVEWCAPGPSSGKQPLFSPLRPRDQKALVREPVSGQHHLQSMLGRILCGRSQFYRANLVCPNVRRSCISLDLHEG